MATYIPELDINLDARETSAYQPSGFQILSTSKEDTSEKHNNMPIKESKGVANIEIPAKKWSLVLDFMQNNWKRLHANLI